MAIINIRNSVFSCIDYRMTFYFINYTCSCKLTVLSVLGTGTSSLPAPPRATGSTRDSTGSATSSRMQNNSLALSPTLPPPPSLSPTLSPPSSPTLPPPPTFLPSLSFPISHISRNLFLLLY